MGEIDQGLQKGPIATSKPTEIWEMRGYVEFNLSQRCFGPAQFEATLLRQTYLRKIVSPRQKKKKRKRFPVSFFFFLSCFRFIALHCKSRRIRGSAVHERKRWTKTPHWRVTMFFSLILLLLLLPIKSIPGYLRIACSFEKFRFSPAMLRLCNFFCKTRRFTKHVHVWRRTFLSLLLLSFSQKNWKQSPSSDYPLYDRFRIVPFLFQNKKKRVWSSFEILVSGHEIFLFFSLRHEFASH